jgi:cathepsin A (carboxypeptidase C)
MRLSKSIATVATIVFVIISDNFNDIYAQVTKNSEGGLRYKKFGEEKNHVLPSTTETRYTKSYIFEDGVDHVFTSENVDGKLCDMNSKSMSGYLDIAGSKYDSHGEGKHLFFWFFEKRTKSLIPSEKHTFTDKEQTFSDDSSIPLIVWLTGGPGCSSSLALLTENGPCKVSKNGNGTSQNIYSWTEVAHVLWLDQPAGVGFSYGEATDKNEKMVSEDAYYFLQAFFKSHPKYKTNPLFIVGESYGGHYAPAIAHKVFDENKNLKHEMIPLNLSGLAVGNGMTNPEIQYQYYPEMAFKNSHGIKVVDEVTYNKMKADAKTCAHLIHKCNEKNSNDFECQEANYQCDKAEMGPYDKTGLNPYDIRKPCGDHPLCYDFSNIEKWLNKASTKLALHISEESNKWQTCNDAVNSKFDVDKVKDFSSYVADMLNSGIPALIYAGDVDFICNYLGNKAWTMDLSWNHKDEFNHAEDHEWGENMGLARSSNGLTFLQVYDAGHMVPTDQPEVALTMINNFLKGNAF